MMARLDDQKAEHEICWEDRQWFDTQNSVLITVPETDIAPKNVWLESDGILVSFWEDLFSGAVLVSGRVSHMFNLLWQMDLSTFLHVHLFPWFSTEVLDPVPSKAVPSLDPGLSRSNLTDTSQGYDQELSQQYPR